MKEGWQEKRLNDVCDLITCGVAAKPHYVDVGVPFLSAKNVKDGKIVWRGYNSISSQTHEELTKHNKPLRGDILYTRVGSFGEAAVVEDDVEFSVFVSLTLIKPKKDFLNNYFLKYYLNSSEIKELAKSSISSSGVGNLNVGTVRQFPINLPPLPEQQRIVAILDDAFESIAIAKANAEKNLQNAKALFESYLDGVFSKGGEGWEEKPLAEICNVKDGTHDSPKYVLEGIPFVTQKNIKDNGFTLENTKFISQDDHDKFYKRSNVAYEDILISMIGANRGMACIVDNKMVFSIKNVGLVKRSDSINPYFLLYFLKSSMAAEYVSTRSKGGAQEFIGLTELRKFPIRITSLMRQDTIVSMLDSVRKETQRLESLYQQKITALDELKKALLHQAFSGQL